MVPAAERDHSHCLLILELIAHIERRLEGETYDRFEKDRDEIDLTAYRLSVIGEETRKLSAEFKARWPNIPWSDIYAMRNVISHDYGRIKPRRVWDTAHDNLSSLAEACGSGIS